MYTIISETTFEINRQNALAHQSLMTLKGERRPKPDRLAFLRAEIRAGQTIQFLWAAVDLNGTRYRINGGHSSYIFAHWPDDEPYPPARARLVIYRVESITQAAELWSKFDSTRSARTDNENLKSLAATDPLFATIGIRQLKVAQGAVITGATANFMALRGLSPAQRFERMRGHSDFIQWFCRGLAVTEKGKYFLRIGVAAAIFGTWKIDAEDAMTFWEQVRDGTDPDPSSATRVLQHRLIVTHVKDGQGAKHKGALPAGEYYKLCVWIWNRWRDGHLTIGALKIPKDPLKPH